MVDNIKNNLIKNNIIKNNINKEQVGVYITKKLSKENYIELITNYFSNQEIIKLFIEFIELRFNSNKPFESLKQFESNIEMLKTINCIEGIKLCLLYSLANNYTTLYPEKYLYLNNQLNTATNSQCTSNDITQYFKGVKIYDN